MYMRWYTLIDIRTFEVNVVYNYEYIRVYIQNNVFILERFGYT